MFGRAKNARLISLLESYVVGAWLVLLQGARLDIPISLIMAPWARRMLLALLALQKPCRIRIDARSKLLCTLSLYGICGVIWFYRGSLHQLASEIRQLPCPCRDRKFCQSFLMLPLSKDANPSSGSSSIRHPPMYSVRINTLHFEPF